MMKRHLLTALVPLCAVLAMPAAADTRHSEQSAARAEMLAGRVMPLRTIEARVLPQMHGMQYLGPDYDAEAQVYRLKFIDHDRVVFVDVDAATGVVLRRH